MTTLLLLCVGLPVLSVDRVDISSVRPRGFSDGVLLLAIEGRPVTTIRSSTLKARQIEDIFWQRSLRRHQVRKVWRLRSLGKTIFVVDVAGVYVFGTPSTVSKRLIVESKTP